MALATGARVALAGIRLVNGTLGLVAPQKLAKKLGADPDDPALEYALRLFGVRTVVIAFELFRGSRSARFTAIPIHASDTLAAALLARRLPARQGAAVVGISALNTVLALLGSRAAR